MRWLGVLIAGSVLSFLFLDFQSTSFNRKDKLSEYSFFKGRLSDLNPSSDVIPYDLNTPLFSNYAEKLRFIQLPKGTQANYNDSIAFEFPEGTILIKNFYYLNDFRKPEKGRKIMETRLLVNTSKGWEAFPYIWNDEQTEGFYDVSGDTKAISYIDEKGKRITTSYVIPNKNQCKGCHIRADRMMPIGPTARNLNRDYTYADKKENQLLHWSSLGLITDIHQSSIPKIPVWNDPKTGSLNDRARAYLDVNCGHCHSRVGPANTSGLFLDLYEKDASHFGVLKSPVAAGRGSGDLPFDIVPGNPGKSILIFRMKTIDPGIAMPEIGREQIHKEGVELMEEWIRNLPH
jgi:uncharacterized repeat protein (TIGR03806 family)